MVAALRARLRPAEPAWIVKRAAVLLAHYFVPNMPADLQTAVAMDWADDLGDLPEFAIMEACRTWRQRDDAKRPTPGQIRALAWDEIRWETELLRDLDRLLAPPKPALPAPEEPKEYNPAFVRKLVAGMAVDMAMPAEKDRGHESREPNQRLGRPRLSTAQKAELAQFRENMAADAAP